MVTQKHPLQITTRTSKTPDFKFELLLLHSPLLEQSLLVSFPPLIDMLKFSGYPYLIRGQNSGVGGLMVRRPAATSALALLRSWPAGNRPPMLLRRVQARGGGTDAQHQARLEG